jgi:hypothetical protein
MTKLNEILSTRNTDKIKGTKKTRNKEKTLLFADDQVIIAETETLMKMSANKLEDVI